MFTLNQLLNKVESEDNKTYHRSGCVYHSNYVQYDIKHTNQKNIFSTGTKHNKEDISDHPPVVN